jgi:predicted porin
MQGGIGDALAAVAATTGALAQSTVTISGNLNINAIGSNKLSTQDGAGTPTITNKSRATGAVNGWTTSQIVFSGTEDLGGGLKASFTVASGLAAGAVGDRDRFLQLAGDFGTVRFGRFVPTAALGFNGYTGAATTGTAGSLYGLAMNVTTVGSPLHQSNLAMGMDSVQRDAGSYERNDNNVQYTSPNFNGLVVNVNYGSSTGDTSNVPGSRKTVQSGFGVTYNAGPLSVGFGTQDRKVQGTAAADAVNSVKGDLDWVGGSYNFGVATLHAAHLRRSDKATENAGNSNKVAINAFGVSAPVGAVTLRASMYRGTNKGNPTNAANASHAKLNGHQLSATYALSKRTTVYAAIGKTSAKDSRDSAENRKFTSNNVGIQHTF